MKYLVCRNNDGIEEIFLFPPSVSHENMWASIKQTKEGTGLFRATPTRTLVSGGYVVYIKDIPTCVGESWELKVCSRRADTALLEAQIHTSSYTKGYSYAMV